MAWKSVKESQQQTARVGILLNNIFYFSSYLEMRLESFFIARDSPVARKFFKLPNEMAKPLKNYENFSLHCELEPTSNLYRKYRKRSNKSFFENY